MTLFVPVFFLIYSFLHYYLYRKLTLALNFSKRNRVLIGLILTVLVISPALWKALDRAGFIGLARLIAVPGLFWMGFIIYFFLSGLFLEILSKFKGFPPKKVLQTATVSAIFLSLYSHLETYFLQVEKYTLKTEKIPAGKRIKILHISDLHLGPLMRENRINMVLKVYKKEKPHLVVATGDIVDGNTSGFAHLSHMLASMKPPLGKYAVVGNHEYYVGLEQSLEFLKSSGFKVLRGEVVNVGNYITLVGIDDPDGKRLGYKVFLEEKEILKTTDPSRYTILLKHRPEVDKSSLPYIDLVLAGHSHGGILFFVGYTILRVIFETDRGIKELGKDKFIIVSKGVGTGGPPMRLLSPPDVVVVVLEGTKP